MLPGETGTGSTSHIAERASCCSPATPDETELKFIFESSVFPTQAIDVHTNGECQ